MKIGIDLDECLTEYVFGFLNYYNNTHKTNFHFWEIKNYKLWELIGGTKEEAINTVYAFHETNYFKELPVVFGAKNAVEELRKFSELLIITSRPNELINKTNQWLDQHFHNKFSNILFTNEWSKSGERKQKSEICKNLKLDFLIEDNLDYALNCSGYVRRVFLLDKPWNQTENGNLPRDVDRVYNWNEILEKIEMVKNGK